MTTEYNSKEEALEMGAFYAGYSTSEDRKRVLAEADITERVLGWPHEKNLEIHTFPNALGVRVDIGISPFREGYDLWIVLPNGVAHRT